MDYKAFVAEVLHERFGRTNSLRRGLKDLYTTGEKHYGTFCIPWRALGISLPSATRHLRILINGTIVSSDLWGLFIDAADSTSTQSIWRYC
jgi:hypothetical protein